MAAAAAAGGVGPPARGGARPLPPDPRRNPVAQPLWRCAACLRRREGRPSVAASRPPDVGAARARPGPGPNGPRARHGGRRRAPAKCMLPQLGQRALGGRGALARGWAGMEGGPVGEQQRVRRGSARARRGRHRRHKRGWRCCRCGRPAASPAAVRRSALERVLRGHGRGRLGRARGLVWALAGSCVQGHGCEGVVAGLGPFGARGGRQG
mmetsp:Transcript_19302/g.73993  ORF Transcript_19302/g.73993 Transcript_19302/m.73993 type:complete len:210 (-) Transcript_19302:1052-1681(-)